MDSFLPWYVQSGRSWPCHILFSFLASLGEMLKSKKNTLINSKKLLALDISKYGIFLQCAPYAPKATAAAPERPANLTKGDPCKTNRSKVGIFSPDSWSNVEEDTNSLDGQHIGISSAVYKR